MTARTPADDAGEVAALQAAVEQLESDLRVAKAGEAFGAVAVAERDHAWAKITRLEVRLDEARAEADRLRATLGAVAAVLDDWSRPNTGKATALALIADLRTILADPVSLADVRESAPDPSINPLCLERNPDLSEYAAMCCRFPKSCSPYMNEAVSDRG